MNTWFGPNAGVIDMASEIADRCKQAQPSGLALRLLRRLLGRGEPWEQHHIETVGVEALREAVKHEVDEEFDLLRSPLIERGRHEAADIVRPAGH